MDSDQQSKTPALPGIGAMGGAPLYVTGEDALCLTVFNAAAGVIVTVTGRMQLLGEDRPKPFSQPLTSATDRSASTARFAIGEGWLLNAQVVVTTGTPAAGQTFARLSLCRGTTSNALELFTLAANYITAKMPLSYPGSPVLGSTEGAGALRSITGSTPAAGAEVSETVPTGARWELLTFATLFTTSAAAAHRVPQLVLDDGALTLFRVGAGLNQAASLAQRRSWFQGAPAPYLDNASNVPLPLPGNIRLPAGARIKTITAAIDAADQYSVVQYLVREWIEGA
jgi:hypothetical protein